MTSTVIHVATAFSPAPAGRDLADGPFPGAKFRDELLRPALGKYDSVTVDLDGTAGMGSSFLEEAFGGLVRFGFSEEVLRRRLAIRSGRASYIERIWGYIAKASEAAHH